VFRTRQQSQIVLSDSEDDTPKQLSSKANRNSSSATSSPTTRRSGPNTVPITAGSRNLAAIELSDDDDDGPAVAEVIAKATESKESHEISDEDEPFPELARAARERARLKDLELATKPPPDAANGIDPDGRTVSPPPAPNPKMEILVSSDLPDTRPIIFNRFLKQRLREVRLAWCQMNKLTEDQTDAVILTWKDRRIFDVTTCKSLGIKADEDKPPEFDGDVVEKDPNRQIHMEATTEEMLRERKEKRRHAEEAQKEDEVLEQTQPVAPKPTEPAVKLILRCQDLPDFKLRVPLVRTSVNSQTGRYRFEKPLMQ
jgi:hypothetical protein